MKKIQNILGMDSQKIKTYFAVVMISQLIYNFSAMKAVLYDPLREALGVNNTEFGFLFSAIGIVQIIGYLFLGWVQDRLNIRRLLTVDMIGMGSVVLLITFVPNLPFAVLLICFIALGFFGDAIFWPTIQKSVRGLARDDKQATAFGVMETLRGGTEFLTNGMVIIIYTVLGSNLLGVKTAMAVNGFIMIFSVLLFRRWIPKDFLEFGGEGGSPRKEAMTGLLSVLKMPIVWCTGISAACIYATFNAVSTYFVPYLQIGYLLPVALAGVFGLFNSSGTRLVISSLSGLSADKFFKSSASMMKVFFLINIVALALICLVPQQMLPLPVCMGLLIIVTVCCFFIRGVYYAPIGESGVPIEHSAAAMSVASFIGYSPSFWAYPVFGSLLDKYPEGQGYRYIFVILLVLSAVGMLVSAINSRLIRKKREA